jgi:hypothetical protein
MRNTYGAKLANKFSRDIRNIIGSPGEHETEINIKIKKIFPHLKLSTDKKSVEEWALKTAKDISYFCGGAGGAITGYGCNLLMILDDPIKNIEEARSENVLEDLEEWYQSTHKTRKELNSDCAEIIIMTRWSIRDTIGKRLETEPGEWKEFIYPAIKNDKSICETIAPTNELLKIRQEFIRAGLEDLWWALYMCEPYEEKGLLFPVTELKRFHSTDLPKFSHYILFVDFADGGGDYFSAAFAGINGSYAYIIDVIFSKKNAEELENDLISKVLLWQPRKIVFEANAGGKMYSVLIKRKIREFLKTIIKTKTSISNKMSRTINWSGIVLEYFKFKHSSEYKPASEYDLFVKNLTSFTRDGKNKNDDAPDTCSGLAEMMGIRKSVSLKVIGGGY